MIKTVEVENEKVKVCNAVMHYDSFSVYRDTFGNNFMLYIISIGFLVASNLGYCWTRKISFNNAKLL